MLYGVQLYYAKCLLKIAPLFLVALGIGIVLGLVHQGPFTLSLLCVKGRWETL